MTTDRRTARGRLPISIAVAVAVAVTATLVAPLTGAVPAFADPALLEYEVGNGFVRTELAYGALTPTARRIVIGPETTTVVLQPELTRPPFGDVFCLSPNGVIESRHWSAEEWNASPTHAVGIIPGSVRTGSSYDIRCERGEDEATNVTWSMIAIEDAPETIRLDSDPSKLVSVMDRVNYTGVDFDTRDVIPGDQVLVTGRPGTWGTTGQEPVATVSIESNASSPRVSGEEIEISPDGASIGFRIPTGLERFYGGEGFTRVTTEYTVPGTPTTPSYTSEAFWFTNFIWPATERHPTTTALRLNRPIGISLRSPEAIVRVRSPGSGSGSGSGEDEGRVVVYVDGKSAGEATIPSGRSATVRVILPKLGRGTHTVRAVFGGTSLREGSSSDTARVRILL